MLRGSQVLKCMVESGLVEVECGLGNREGKDGSDMRCFLYEPVRTTSGCANARL
jgi:hypothetical protein